MTEIKDKCAFPECNKELKHTEGKKKKKYCNNVCAVRDWQKKNPKVKAPRKTVMVPVEKWSELEKKINAYEDAARQLAKDAIENGIKVPKSTEDFVNNSEQKVKKSTDVQQVKEESKPNIPEQSLKELPKKHKLWKQGDPDEKSNAFYLRYDAFTYDEIEKNKKQ